MATAARRSSSTARNPARPVVVNSYDVDASTTALPWGSFNRMSLRAVIGGALVALAVMFAMSMLGLAIGATTLDSLVDLSNETAFDPAAGIVIWLVVTDLVALFIGGWVAARLAAVPDQVDGMLHGLVTWAVVTLVSLWLFTTATGQILNAAAGAVGTAYDALNQGAAAVVPSAASAVERRDMTLDTIRQEARDLSAQNNPNAQSGQVEPSGEIASDTAEQILQNPGSAGDAIQSAVDRLFAFGPGDQTTRDDLVTLLAANTSLTEDEARATVDDWEQRYSQVATDAENAISDAGKTLTDAIAAASGLVLALMLVSAFAAGAAGYVSAPTIESLADVHTEED